MKAVRRILGALVLVVAVGTAAAAVLATTYGYRLYVVHTGSMVPTLRPGYVVVDRPVTGALRKGQIITFRYPSGPDSVVTHRLVSDDAGEIRTKGDANPTPDPWVLRRSQVVGTPLVVLPAVGYVLVYLRQPTGAASAMTLVLAVWMLWGICFGSRGVGRRQPAPEPA